jgi:hypothetical protein
VQADGKILIGGEFTTVGGVTRSYIARLTNTDAALQELSITTDGSTITWMRGQASPELWRVTFEHSTDGVIWTSLGEGIRITGGWQLNGLSLPFNENHYVRARGYATRGGYQTSCSSIYESVRMFYLKSTTTIKDFNSDGHPDILWRNPATGDNYVWFMNGTTLTGSALLLNVPAPWEIVGR